MDFCQCCGSAINEEDGKWVCFDCGGFCCKECLRKLGEDNYLDAIFSGSWDIEQCPDCAEKLTNKKGAFHMPKRMIVEHIRFSEHGGSFPEEFAGKNGYELRLEQGDGSYGTSMRCVCNGINEAHFIPADFLEKVLEAACLGYQLVQAQHWERITVGKVEE